MAYIFSVIFHKVFFLIHSENSKTLLKYITLTLRVKYDNRLILFVCLFVCFLMTEIGFSFSHTQVPTLVGCSLFVSVVLKYEI